MGSGRMAGGFDGWLGAAPAGGGGGGTGVQSVVAGAGIGVDNTDPQNPIVSNTGVRQIVAGTGVTVSGGGVGVVTIGLAATLAQLYQFGVGDNPTADNSLIGTAPANTTSYTVYFDTDGELSVKANVATNGGDFDSRPAITTQRDFTSAGVVGVHQWFKQRYSGGADENTNGGVEQRFSLLNIANTENMYDRYQVNTTSPGARNWYSPQIVNGNPLTSFRHIMEDGRGGGHTSTWYHNSDGNGWFQGLFPNAGGPYKLPALQLSFETLDGGTAQNGSQYGFRWTGPALDTAYASNAGVAAIYGVLTAQNFGSAQAAGRLDFWTSTLAGGEQLSFQIMPPNDAALSTASASSVSYTTAVNRLSLSNNAGAYSPIATLADLAPTTSHPLVDIASTTQDLKTATTFTVVPNTAGRKFMPIYAYLEIVTATAVTVGPTLKLGNNGAHDNVAPAMAVSSTVAAADAVPFVMASSPAIIDLNATGIICELTVNASATTLTGIVHVVGVYTT